VSAALTFEEIAADPVGFCRRVLGFEPWSRQAAILESVRDHRRTAVRSGHGVGKTSTSARVVLWWLASAPGSIAITTSATFAQVREQLWREIAIGFHASDGFIDGTLTDTRLELGPDWFALGLSTDTPERFAGYHAERLLVVLDEASGVSEEVWEAAETLITSPASRLLAVGNPTRPAGSFYRAFTSERELYSLLHVSALDSPAVTGERVPAAALRRLVGPEWIEDRRRAWGEGSPLFQVRVLGEFPSSSDDTVCAVGEVEAAVGRRLTPGSPAVIGCDVARFGSDETVIAARRGSRVRVVDAYRGKDLMHTTGAIVRAARGLEAESGERPVLVVDDAGVGGGVTDRLRELGGFRVIAFNGGAAARDRADYPNRRSEAWFAFAEQLDQIDLDGDEQLVADLVAPRYALDSHSRRVVEAKAVTKKRLGRSPDRADAVLLTFDVGAGSIPAASLNADPAPEFVQGLVRGSGGSRLRSLWGPDGRSRL